MGESPSGPTHTQISHMGYDLNKFVLVPEEKVRFSMRHQTKELDPAN